MKNFNFKPRASKVADLFVNPRSKSELLSETTKTYLTEFVISEYTGKSKIVSSKYMEKGIQAEEESITLLSKYYKKVFQKNDKCYENDILKGTPDIVTENCIYELKTSWDVFTFPYFENNVDKKYYYQCQAYMNLTGVRNCKLVYCLVNTPPELANYEIQKQINSGRINTQSEIDKLHNNFVFDDLSLLQRIKIYDIPYDNNFEAELRTKIEYCQDFINSFVFENEIKAAL